MTADARAVKTVTRIAGCDEVGRGTWAGPVVAAAVILDPATPVPGLADSKTLSAARRAALDIRIRASCLGLGIGWASAAEIDAINILCATMLAMQRAVAALPLRPDLVLVDGNRCPSLNMPARAIIRGDTSEPAISAASIVAKQYRDARMRDLALDWPGYGFERHVGYGTIQHRVALARLGPCPEHRHSFSPIRRLKATVTD